MKRRMAAQQMLVNGKPHDLILLRVLEYDANGRPTKAEIGYPDTLFSLDDPAKPNEFITAYAPAEA